MSVGNTTLYLYTKIIYFVRATCFDLIRSSSDPARRQIQELFMFHCIVASQILTNFCQRSVKYIRLYMFNLCDGVDIKLEPYLEWQYIKITVYKIYRNQFKISQVNVVNYKLPYIKDSFTLQYLESELYRARMQEHMLLHTSPINFQIMLQFYVKASHTFNIYKLTYFTLL